MTTDLIKGRLLNGALRGDDYDAFLERNRICIDSLLRIKYRAKIREIVDVKKIFLYGFKGFINKELSELKFEKDLDVWAQTAIRKRVDEIQSKVFEQYAKELIAKGGKDNYLQAYNELLQINDKAIRMVVSKLYDGDKYKGYFQDIVQSLTTSFIVNKIGETESFPATELENMNGWFYKVFYNFAQNKDTRLGIDKEFGLEFYKNPPKDTKSSNDEDGTISDETELDGYDDEDDDAEMSNQNVPSLEIDVQTLTDDIDLEDEWENPNYTPAAKLERLLGLLKNRDYAEWIRAKEIEQVPISELAEEWKMDLEKFKKYYKRAKIELMVAAVPQIQKFSCCIFDQYGHLLEVSDNILLSQFFHEKLSIKELAVTYKQTNTVMKTKVYQAFSKLKRIQIAERKAYDLGKSKNFDKRQRQEKKEYEQIYNELMS